MGYLEFCSSCGNKNVYGHIDGEHRYHCATCKTIHYENPKPTATIICTKNEIKGYGVGRITSVTYSPGLGHWIGLGFIKGGFEKWKDIIVVGADPIRNKEIDLEIVSPHMFDPKGERLHG